MFIQVQKNQIHEHHRMEAGSGIGALNLDLNSKSRRGNNAAVSLADAESIEIDRTVRILI